MTPSLDRARNGISRALPALATLIGLGMLAAACARPGARLAGAPQPAERLTVAAASDMRLALPEVTKAFTKQTGVRVTITYGSTGILAGQIENGAPFDVFLSAHRTPIGDLVSKGIVADARQYAEGAIVVIGKAGTIGELKNDDIKKIAIANPDHAPYGMAAKEALEQSGIWPEVKNKLVYGDSVSAAQELVRSGNAEAGIGALSLAKPGRIAYAPVDPSLYHPIEQWAGIVSESDHTSAASRFIDFLRGRVGRRILKSYGFATVDSEPS